MSLSPLYCFMSLSVVFLIAGGALAEEETQLLENLAENPGFEEWPERPEDDSAWGAVGYSVGVDGREDAPPGVAFRTGEGEEDTERRSGDYAQYIQSFTYGRGAIASGIPVLVDFRYRISVWAKVETGYFELGVCYAHDPWTHIGDWERGEADGEWTQLTKEIVIPEDCRSIAVMMFFQYGSGYLDDLEVVELGPAGLDEAAAEPTTSQ